MRLNPLISARNLEKSYQSGRIVTPVLRDISLDFYTGELAIILGPSGSGKSTLLAALGGLIKADSGDVTLEKKSFNQLSAKQLEAIRLQYFGFIFQGFNLFKSLTAYEQIAIALQYCGFNAEEVKHRAQKALEQVEMGDKGSLKPQALSGGQKQRIAIARAAAKSPDVLFADEPTSSLDTENTLLVVKLLKLLSEHNRTAVILVTHDTRLLPYAQRIITVEDGMVVSDERPG